MILKVRPRPRASAGPKNSLEMHTGDFPGSPVIKNLASTAGDKGLIPDQGTKIPHATGPLSPLMATKESLWTTTKTQCKKK